jgi:hypothetical protein
VKGEGMLCDFPADAGLGGLGQGRSAAGREGEKREGVGGEKGEIRRGHT